MTGIRDIVLASASRSRRLMLEAAGLAFRAEPAEVDEVAIRDALLEDDAGIEPADVAAFLAAAKAEQVSRRFPHAFVIGADQVLALDGRLFGKPADLERARSTLLELRGRTHQLHSGVAIAERGAVAWQHLDTAHLTMRTLTSEFLDIYLERAGAPVCQSVGAYQIESIGVQLFERIEGDYFTILGLPLLPLLGELRARGAIPS